MKRTLLSLFVLACLLVSVSGCSGLTENVKKTGCGLTRAVKKADQWVKDVLW
ncbi:MAG: hypothetical protein P9M07_08120 [Candidatus Aceula meridiana]|nr:hypothetical protein [Candidatus Aceula meridiana]